MSDQQPFNIYVPFHAPARPNLFELIKRHAVVLVLGGAALGYTYRLSSTPAPPPLPAPIQQADPGPFPTVPYTPEHTDAQGHPRAHIVVHNCGLPTLELARDRHDNITAIASNSTCDEAIVTEWQTQP